MSEEARLPKAVVHRATWDGAPGWRQYHDERDPLPAEWGDEPPDEVQGFYTADQLRAAIEQERERIAQMLEHTASFISGPHESDGQYVLLHRCASAIRSGVKQD